MPPNLTAADVDALERRNEQATSVDGINVDKDDGDMNMGQQEDGAEGVNLSAAVDNLRNQVIAAVIHDMGLLWAYIRKLRERLSM